MDTQQRENAEAMQPHGNNESDQALLGGEVRDPLKSVEPIQREPDASSGLSNDEGRMSELAGDGGRMFAEPDASTGASEDLEKSTGAASTGEEPLLPPSREDVHHVSGGEIKPDTEIPNGFPDAAADPGVAVTIPATVDSDLTVSRDATANLAFPVESDSPKDTKEDSRPTQDDAMLDADAEADDESSDTSSVSSDSDSDHAAPSEQPKPVNPDEGNTPAVPNIEAFQRQAVANITDPTAEWAADSASSTTVSTTSSDSDDSSDISIDADAIETARRMLDAPDFDDDDGPKGGATQLKTANEQDESYAPIPAIVINESMPIEQLGEIESMVDNVIVVKGSVSGAERVLEPDTLVCLASRMPVGVIADVIGQVTKPHYTIGFADIGDISRLELAKGTPIYFPTQLANYAFTAALRALKFSDASNQHDEENVPDKDMYFSDDEEERAYKARKKQELKARKAGRDPSSQPANLRGGFGRNGPKTAIASAAYPSTLSYDDDEPPTMSPSEVTSATEGYTPLTRPDNFTAMLNSPPPHPPGASFRDRGRSNGRPRARGGRGRGGQGQWSDRSQNRYQQQPQQRNDTALERERWERGYGGGPTPNSGPPTNWGNYPAASTTSTYVPPVSPSPHPGGQYGAQQSPPQSPFGFPGAGIGAGFNAFPPPPPPHVQMQMQGQHAYGFVPPPPSVPPEFLSQMAAVARGQQNPQNYQQMPPQMQPQLPQVSPGQQRFQGQQSGQPNQGQNGQQEIPDALNLARMLGDMQRRGNG